MKIENQLVSLLLTKELKRLDVKQDSLWYYAKFEDDSYLDVTGASQPDAFFQLIQRGFFEFEQFDEIYSACTVAELGEMLPRYTKSYRIATDRFACKFCELEEDKKGNPIHGESIIKVCDTEADARANMLIYCIKHNLIET